MKLIVKPHTIEIVKDLVNEKEIDITKCEFEFADEITNDYVKEAYFTYNGTTYKQIIQNNECKIPYEVLKDKGMVEIGVVAYKLENDEYVKRYNPSPAYFNSLIGSLKEEYENSEPITPTDKEQIEQMLNNINVDANKEGKITTITIAFKDGTTKEVTLEDGMGIDYNWVGTQLGIKREDEQEYEYVDLKGEKGDAGAIKMRIVQELPFVGDDDTIYLVPLEEPETEENRYAEYIYVNNQWELLGKIGIQIDLSDYYTKSQVYNKEETDTKVNVKYTKPSDGIPKTDLDQSVQRSLSKADSSIQNIDGKEDKSNKVTSLSNTSTDTQYPSAKCVYESQETQNTNIQTLQEKNNELKGILNNIYDIDNYLINNHSIESEETTENITLNNTMNKAPMHLNFKGQIQQNSTTGKNLFKPFNYTRTNNGINFTYSEDGYINCNGTSTGNALSMNTASSTTYQITLQTGTYTISGDTADIRLELLDSSGNVLGLSDNNRTFTINEETNVFIRANIVSGKTLNNVKVYPQLELGSSATSWEKYSGGEPSPSPSYPQDIHIVSGDNEIRVCNKNLFDKNSENIITNKFLNASGGEISDGSLSISDYIKVNPNTDYSITPYQNIGACLCYYDSSKTFISSIGRYVINQTFTTPNNCYYIRISIRNNEINNLMLEEGLTATDYVEHKEYTKEISLGELEVGGIGEYEDEFFKNIIDSEYYDSTLEKDKWYLKKRIGKVVLDGSENYWRLASSDNNNSLFTTALGVELINALSDNIPIITNYFNYNGRIETASSALSGGIGCYTLTYNSTGKITIYFVISKSEANNVTIWRDWLSTHNTIVYYVLATPENILLNDTLQETLDSFYSWQEQTNISQENNDLPFVIKARAIREIL